MKRALRVLLLAPAMIFLSSCSTVETGPTVGIEPYIPKVTMPRDVNRNEEVLLPEVAQVLERNGMQPSGRGGEEFQLAFSVNDGPVNADVTIELFQGNRRVAHSYARTGGPRIILRRQDVIRESFEKALANFEGQLPRGGGGGGGAQAPQTWSESWREQPDGGRSSYQGYPGENPYGPVDRY